MRLDVQLRTPGAPVARSQSLAGPVPASKVTPGQCEGTSFDGFLVDVDEETEGAGHARNNWAAPAVHAAQPSARTLAWRRPHAGPSRGFKVPRVVAPPTSSPAPDRGGSVPCGTTSVATSVSLRGLRPPASRQASATPSASARSPWGSLQGMLAEGPRDGAYPDPNYLVEAHLSSSVAVRDSAEVEVRVASQRVDWGKYIVPQDDPESAREEAIGALCRKDPDAARRWRTGDDTEESEAASVAEAYFHSSQSLRERPQNKEAASVSASKRGGSKLQPVGEPTGAAGRALHQLLLRNQQQQRAASSHPSAGPGNATSVETRWGRGVTGALSNQEAEGAVANASDDSGSDDDVPLLQRMAGPAAPLRDGGPAARSSSMAAFALLRATSGGGAVPVLRHGGRPDDMQLNPPGRSRPARELTWHDPSIASTPQRVVGIPAEFPSVSALQAGLQDALFEEVSLQIADLGKRFHRALQRTLQTGGQQLEATCRRMGVPYYSRATLSISKNAQRNVSAYFKKGRSTKGRDTDDDGDDGGDGDKPETKYFLALESQLEKSGSCKKGDVWALAVNGGFVDQGGRQAAYGLGQVTAIGGPYSHNRPDLVQLVSISDPKLVLPRRCFSCGRCGMARTRTVECRLSQSGDSHRVCPRRRLLRLSGVTRARSSRLPS